MAIPITYISTYFVEARALLTAGVLTMSLWAEQTQIFGRNFV